jgi:hypothetical protein
MPATALLTKLRAQQQRVLAAAEAFKAFAAAPHPGDIAPLAALRWRFTREMLLHFACLEAELLQPLVADRRNDAATRAVHSSQDLEQVYRHFQRHAARWHGLPPPGSWQEYAQAIAVLMRLIAVRIAAQERDIYKLLPLQPGGARRVLAFAPLNYAAEAWKVRSLIYDDAQASAALR